MGMYVIRRILMTIPVMFGVAFVCFLLVYIAPGDPLLSILPPDASEAMQREMMHLYGFDRSFLEQFFAWMSRVLQGDLGTSIATSRSVAEEVFRAVGNTVILSVAATLIGFGAGTFLGFVSGYFPGTKIDRIASFLSVVGVSVPHYWLGMVLVSVFAAVLMWLPAGGAGPSGSEGWAFDMEHMRYLLLPALTMSVVPTGLIARTVRALVSECMSQEFILGLKAKGLDAYGVFRHVVKNIAPTALAVMGLELGYLLGGSILIETVFNWPGTGLLLNNAIFTRDLPLLQGTILVLASFFVILNMAVDILQTLLDPRISR